MRELSSYADSVHRPYIHLVDGGLSDNLGLRGVPDIIETFEALHTLGQPTPLDHVRRIIIVVVNAKPSPDTAWDESQAAPGSVALLIKATGVPIEAYSSDTVELLRDIQARWQSQRKIRDSAPLSADPDAVLTEAMHGPHTDLYVVDVSFQALEDRNELVYLNNLPTSLVLPDAAVDHLRAAAGKILLASPEFQRLLNDAGARIITEPCTDDDSTASPSSTSPATARATGCVARQLDSGSR